MTADDMAEEAGYILDRLADQGRDAYPEDTDDRHYACIHLHDIGESLAALDLGGL